MLSEKQIIEILDKGTISQQAEGDKKQVMEFAFGKEFMESDDKGERKVYKKEYKQ